MYMRNAKTHCLRVSHVVAGANERQLYSQANMLELSLCHFLSADCSGNGVAVAVGDCGSRCVCSVRWTGTCCETRQPWMNWGDPHLETLDGRPVLPIRQKKLTLKSFDWQENLSFS